MILKLNPQVEWNLITDSKTNRPRTIVVKFLQYKEKTKIFKSANILKGQNIFMNNDFSKVASELRKNLMIEVERLRKLGAYLNYTATVAREKMEERDQKQIFFGQQEYSSNQILNHGTHFPCKKAL